MRLKNVHGAPYAKPTPVQHMCVDHGRRNMTVSQEFLHRADIVAILQEMSGEGMRGEVDVSLLRSLRKMTQADFAPEVIEQLGRIASVLR